ncbi:unnamed protein product [Mytilus coruscus]|uniref:Uncharacterized protein n=1 Tax=Mytilus coruscus TaxID=42192 RepID=A0A6J8E0P9_MYTCO|nr:unnamed protein product [Mytilus coruscus]
MEGSLHKDKNRKNITKLNNQVQEIKEKWAEKYREAALKPISKEELKNDRGDVQKLKHEIDQIKRKPQREEETELNKHIRKTNHLIMSNRKNRSFKARDKKRKIAKNKEKRKIYNINRQHKRRQYKHTEKVLRAAKYVDIFTKEKLCNAEILVLAKGLKFIPSPNLRNAKKTLINDFNELARKMRCKYHFDNGSHQHNRHPFLSKSGYKPNWANNAIENYLFSTRIELEKIQIKSFKDSLPKNKRKALQSLRSNDHIIIKKADKTPQQLFLIKSYILKWQMTN